ncbi:MobC family plasmid mobilization relaxosome protein [Falsiroseomonas tokyonensis]|uniref:MobC family plasmid mobilization relaxosome protein n=1 Tax=Falsiroseomonas tokyonensis TaxID=430521 RepID=A0ABV7C1S2_9PROT|nr:MobC family plasmid mobilization relaxosome protein [Falsiroseomonas tokyonensis]MBU8541745.1 MobC family plasmid mobilization relaxosome protein [Falsiroseomonas tokyonensis]
MPVPADKTLLNAYVDRDLADRFKAWARPHGGVSAALRRVVEGAVAEHEPEPPLGAAGFHVTVRLREGERELLLAAARARGMPVAAYLRSLAVVHLAGRPQWGPEEAEALRELGGELRRIGNNVNQIARALNVAVQKGEYPAGQGAEAKEAARLVRAQLRRLLAIYTGNLGRWGQVREGLEGVPRGLIAEAEEREGRSRAKRRPKPRRPASFNG